MRHEKKVKSHSASRRMKFKNCILYLVLSIKYENDKWKLEIRPAKAGLKLRN